MNHLLIAVLVFLAVMAVIGAVKGLAKMVLSVAALALACVLVWFSAPYAQKIILEKTDMDERLAVKVTEKLHGLIENDTDLEEKIEQLPVTEGLKETLRGTKDSFDQKLSELGTQIAELIFRAAVWLVLFLIFYIVLRLIACFIEKAADSDGLRFINRSLGSVLALLEGVLFLDLLALVLLFFSGSEFGMKVYALIYENELLTWAYNHNLLLILLNQRMG